MNKRLNKIIEILNRNYEVSIEDLCKAFSTSYATIRRDLIKLENEGLIKRKNGNVSFFEPPQGMNKPLGIKALEAADKKDEIAKYAATLIEDNQTIFLDAGSSVFAMSKYIYKKNILVVTNNIQLGVELNKRNIKTFLLPGILDANRYSLNSPYAKKYINMFNFDIAFIATTGVNKLNGYMANSETACDLKQSVINRSKKIYFICDSSKYGKNCMTKIAELNVGTMITDKNDGYFDQDSDIKIIETSKMKKYGKK